jgi:hypothetical protein
MAGRHRRFRELTNHRPANDVAWQVALESGRAITELFVALEPPREIATIGGQVAWGA